MYKRLLVPLDGSELAEVVLSYAKELAGRLDLEVVLLHVYGPDERELLPMRQAYVERAAEICDLQCQEVRQTTGGHPETGGWHAKGILAAGRPAEEILSYAEDHDIDLILMATHGRSGISRWALGSVADKVLRASRVPVWLIRADIQSQAVHDKWSGMRMLVPLDGSLLSESVLPHVQTLAKQRGPRQLEIVLLRVAEPPVVPADYPASLPVSWEEHVEQEVGKSRQACLKYLDGLQQRLKEANLTARAEVLVGDPAEAIAEYAGKHPLDLIVMSTHGRSGPSRWVYGSVTEKVLQAVNSPVFLVRPR